MKQALLLLLLMTVYPPSFGQQNNVFKTITESIEPYETRVRDIEKKIAEVAVDTTIGPMGMRETYFKKIGIGFFGSRQSHANVVIVHIKETNQQSDEYFFKKNLKVQDVYKKLGKPNSYRYNPDTEILSIHYKDMMGYEITGVQLPKHLNAQLATDKPLPFNKIFPSVKKSQIDYLIIDFAYDMPPPVIELMEIN